LLIHGKLALPSFQGQRRPPRLVGAMLAVHSCYSSLLILIITLQIYSVSCKQANNSRKKQSIRFPNAIKNRKIQNFRPNRHIYPRANNPFNQHIIYNKTPVKTIR
jgi:hypothetical protein